MTVLIASDIHGSAYYMRQLLNAIGREKPDLVVLLGDIYNHGPRNPLPREYAPKAVAEMLNGIADKLLVIKGNCDSEVDEMISRFPIVASGVVALGDRRVWLTHGHIYNKDNMPPCAAGDILVYGHFHTRINEVVDGVLALNPGSISLPKDDWQGYLTMDEHTAAFVDLDGIVAQKVDLDAFKKGDSHQ